MTESMTETERITILLIDDEAMIRAGLRALLENSGSFSVVGETGEARDGINKARELQPDVVRSQQNALSRIVQRVQLQLVVVTLPSSTHNTSQPSPIQPLRSRTTCIL